MRLSALPNTLQSPMVLEALRFRFFVHKLFRTNMTGGLVNGGVAGVNGMLEPQEVADCVIRTLDEERFLVLPHPTVLTYMQRKTSDYDRWLNGMRRLNDRFSI